MTQNPKSVPEWQAYIETLEGETLFESVERANSVKFVRHLKSDGLDGKAIRLVFEAFVRRLEAGGEQPPAGGYFDLRKMLDELDQS